MATGATMSGSLATSSTVRFGSASWKVDRSCGGVSGLSGSPATAASVAAARTAPATIGAERCERAHARFVVNRRAACNATGMTADRAGSGARRGVKGIMAKLTWTTRPRPLIQNRSTQLRELVRPKYSNALGQSSRRSRRTADKFVGPNVSGSAVGAEVAIDVVGDGGETGRLVNGGGGRSEQVEIGGGRIGEQAWRGRQQVAALGGGGAIAQVDGGVGKVVAGRAARAGGETEFNGVDHVAVEDKGVVVDRGVGRIPGDDRAVGACRAAGGHESRG